MSYQEDAVIPRTQVPREERERSMRILRLGLNEDGAVMGSKTGGSSTAATADEEEEDVPPKLTKRGSRSSRKGSGTKKAGVTAKEKKDKEERLKKLKQSANEAQAAINKAVSRAYANIYIIMS